MKRFFALVILLLILDFSVQAQQSANVARGHGKPLITAYELPAAELEIFKAKDGLARVRRNRKWGWVDDSFRLVVSAKYDYVHDFGGDLGLVEIGDKKGLINRNGVEILPCVYDEISHGDHDAMDYEHYYSYEQLVVRKDSLSGIVEGSGRALTPTIYKYIERLGGVYALYKKDSLPTFITQGFKVIAHPGDGYSTGEGWQCRISDGIFPVHRKKWGMMDTTGKLVIDCIYDRIDHNYTAGCIYANKDGEWHYLDKVGNNTDVMCKLKAGTYHNGYGIVRENNLEGLKDSTGMLVVAVAYDKLGCNTYEWCWPKNGFIPVKKDKKWGIAKLGKGLVIPCVYDDFKEIVDGTIPIKKNRKWGVTDTTGRLLVPALYDDAVSFSEGLANVKQDNKWGYADTTGKLVIPCKYEERGDFKNGRAKVGCGDLKKIIDRTGAVHLDSARAGFIWMGAFHDGMAMVRDSNGYFGLLIKVGSWSSRPFMNKRKTSVADLPLFARMSYMAI